MEFKTLYNHCSFIISDAPHLTDAMSSMKESLKSIQQQNFIQAKEKGFDKK